MRGTIITIDSNEHSHYPEHKERFEAMGILCLVKSLPFDFQVSCPDGSILNIERKTPRDYLDSLRDGRLFNQVNDLVEGNEWGYVVIEGWFEPLDDHFLHEVHRGEKNLSGWQWSSLQGSLTSIQEMGCTVVYDPDFHGAVERLINRSRNDVKVAPRRQSYVFSPHEQVYMAFDGIGSDKAQKIASEFGNLGKGLEWLTDLTAKNISGIGYKTKEKIINSLGGRLFFASEDGNNG